MTSTLRAPWAAATERWRQWWSARLPPSDTLALTQRNVYILPTAAGWMLALTLLVLLVASINFQLNLGYLLTFLLAGSVAVSVHLSHATLRGLQLRLLLPEPQFLGAGALLQVQLHNAARATRYGLAVAVRGSSAAQWAWTDVPGQDSATVQVAFQPARRGLQAVPTLKLETRYPLGTFRVWALWRPAAQVLVYPRPETPAPPLPPAEPRTGGSGQAPARGVGEFDGVRAYRRGDPLKLVVWKKAARSLATGTSGLVSRDTQQSQRHELWLDFAATGLQAPEARLSRLTAWVLQADRLGADYGLRLPGRQIAPDHGPAHRRRCLEALALS
ncbi:DUF58 domain-containing protein [Alicycliphilus denitrificans]|uniref:DUF58 domain-containing protein n=1 Tax=Alicycliphilus denitrificans TaxID=179636 RepID=UPI00384BE768